ncbi:hypothetical protein [Paenibacillus sp. DMB20]|uniref:hypothetical protein n=1 Tax=Paenibacillus sp. DMB20 TaxID=1642570 RepID=UPI0006274F6A|nr:hypothetical protein [Paenibacillus sp. DMB20]KKO51128.1 hypothetical protein XI25_29520 [Paenibacillus sp. DMB20]
MTPEQQLRLWEDELALATQDLWTAERLDDRGGIAWNEERIRWAKIQINNLTDLDKHKKGA